MNTQSNTEAKAIKPKLKPDFSHRLGLFDGDATPHSMADVISLLALQADSIITMIGLKLILDDGLEKTNDETIYWALESVRATIKDMNAIVAAYYEANRPETNDQQA